MANTKKAPAASKQPKLKKKSLEKVAKAAKKVKAAPKAAEKKKTAKLKATIKTEKVAKTPSATPITQPEGAFALASKTEVLQNAIAALRNHLKSEKSKSTLGSGEEYIEVQIDLCKTAHSKSAFSIPLPHSIYHRKGVTICLLTKDTQDEWEDRLSQNPIENVTRVISVSKLGSDFKPFEHRRLLNKQHDLFICDEAIKPMLPTLLGRDFISSYKAPVKVNMITKFNHSIAQARDSTHVKVPVGTTLTVRVGHSTQTDKQLIENLQSVLPALKTRIPRRVQALKLRSESSISLPLFVDFASVPQAGELSAVTAGKKGNLKKKLTLAEKTLQQRAHRHGLTMDQFKATVQYARSAGFNFTDYIRRIRQLGLKPGDKLPPTEAKKEIRVAKRESPEHQAKQAEQAARRIARNAAKLAKMKEKFAKVAEQKKKVAEEVQKLAEGEKPATRATESAPPAKSDSASTKRKSAPAAQADDEKPAPVKRSKRKAE